MRRPTSVASQNITERALGWWLVFISLVEFRQSFLKELLPPLKNFDETQPGIGLDETIFTFFCK